MNASLNKKQNNVKWGEYRLGDLFDINNTLSFNTDKLVVGKEYDYVTRTSLNQGILQTTGFVNSENINSPGTWSLGLLQMDFFYRNKPWYAGQFVRKITPKIEISKGSILYFTTLLNKQKQRLLSVLVRNIDKTFKEITVKLPITPKGELNFDFMESFIAELEAERVAELEAERVAELEAERVAELEAERVAELEAERVAELEAERVAELSAYLKVSGLDNYELSSEEENVIKEFSSLKWDTYNLERLFGKSTRGKRLKSADRISGVLPFVTAGEAEEGISAYISNKVQIFSENTTTIDMFGSAKYRNYKYGADDHVAVVHTEKVPKYAAIFITSAIHKAAHTGKFNYSKNFYAKDADELNISLPCKDDKPDYSTMSTLISAIQKLVIKDVVLYADRRINATKQVIKY